MCGPGPDCADCVVEEGRGGLRAGLASERSRVMAEEAAGWSQSLPARHCVVTSYEAV